MTKSADCDGGAVLVALDGSPAAATALPIAVTLAEQLAARLEVLHVVPAPRSVAEARQAVCQDAPSLPDIAVHVVVGDPAETIVRASAEPDVVLVVMTTHGRVIEAGRELGRVAQAVVTRATRPIVLVRPEAVAAFMEHGPRVRHLLLPLDGTPTTARLLRPVTALAHRLSAAIDLLYVAADQPAAPTEPGSIGAPRYVDQPHHEWPEWSSEVIARLGTEAARCPPDVPVRMFLGSGDISQEIVRFARDHHVDVVVVARRSHGEPGRARVLRAVLRDVPCPLLLVGAADPHRRERMSPPQHADVSGERG